MKQKTKKSLKCFVFLLPIIIVICLFLGNLIRNVCIINKIYSFEEKMKDINNYIIDYEIKRHQVYTDYKKETYSQNEKQTFKYIVKDNNTRIKEYSYNGAAFEPYKLKTSTLKCGSDKEAKELLNKMYLNKDNLDKKIILKEYLFKPIKKEDGVYKFVILLNVTEEFEEFVTYWCDKENGGIVFKDVYEVEKTNSKIKTVQKSVEENFKITLNTVTDEFLYE